MHSQPPLFNLFLGVGLKLFGDPTPFFHVCFLVMSFATLYLLFRCMLEIKIPRGLAYVAVILFGLNPSLFLFENYLFYTLWEAFFVTFGLFCLLRNRIAGFAALMTLLLFTRASFHPAWMLGIAAGLALYFPRLRCRALAIPIVASGLWMVKNGLLVGSFAMSSAMGMGVMKNALLHMKTSEIARLDRIAVVPPFAPVDRYREWTGPERATGVRALDYPGTATCPNPNHIAYVDVSRKMRDVAFSAIRRHPEAYFATIGDAVAIFLSSSASYDVPAIRIESLALLESVYVALVSPAVIALGFLLAGMLGLRWVRRSPALFFAVGTILYLSTVTLLLEIGENQRVRFALSPLLFWTLFYLGRIFYESYLSRGSLNRFAFFFGRDHARQA